MNNPVAEEMLRRTMLSGESIPRLGLGTWRMGNTRSTRKQESAVLRYGIERGITLIDTAEMYGEGGAEEVVGEALRETACPREEIFVVSKVYPWNASRRGTVAACERSLKRMGIGTIDLYLLHWRGEHPLADTIAAFDQLQREGKIRYWGVSNFDTDDMRELGAVTDIRHCAANQVYYNLAKRWPEATLLPWQRQHGLPIMAYSPLDQGRLIGHKTIASIAARHHAAPAQIALAWLLLDKDVITIPMTSRIAGVDEILGVPRVKLDAGDLALLSTAFPPPRANARMETT